MNNLSINTRCDEGVENEFDTSHFECSICFNRFGLIHVPTTLPCGHSMCIAHSHLLGGSCPTCRRSFSASKQKPSYSLRDGAHAFWVLMIGMGYTANEDNYVPNRVEAESVPSESENVIESDSPPVAHFHTSPGSSSTLSPTRQALENIDVQNPPTINNNLHQIVHQRSVESLTRFELSRRTEIKAECGHICSINSLTKCCFCSDLRPRPSSGLYPVYVDGAGWVDRGTRSENYCSHCRNRRSPNTIQQSMESSIRDDIAQMQNEIARAHVRRDSGRNCTIM